MWPWQAPGALQDSAGQVKRIHWQLGAWWLFVLYLVEGHFDYCCKFPCCQKVSRKYSLKIFDNKLCLVILIWQFPHITSRPQTKIEKDNCEGYEYDIAGFLEKKVWANWTFWFWKIISSAFFGVLTYFQYWYPPPPHLIRSWFFGLYYASMWFKHEPKASTAVLLWFKALAIKINKFFVINSKKSDVWSIYVFRITSFFSF